MKIKSYKKIKKNTYRISFEGLENDILLYDDIILKYNLLCQKEIEQKKLQEIKKENDSLDCYYKVVRYLASKNRCKKEVKEYLKKNSLSEKEINDMLKKLEEQKLINEEKYLEAFIHDQVSFTSHGPNKIIKKLLELDFQEEQIKKVLDQYSKEIWLEKLEKIIQKKMKANHKDSERKLKEKILYSCMNEGYSKEDIELILDKQEIPKNLDTLEKETEKIYTKLQKKYEEPNLSYQVKGRLLNKGFSYEDIDSILEKIKSK